MVSTIRINILVIEFHGVLLHASFWMILSQLNFSNCCNKLDNFRMLTFEKYPTLIMQHRHVKKLFRMYLYVDLKGYHYFVKTLRLKCQNLWWMDDALTVSINYSTGICRIFCLYFFAKSRYIKGFSQQKCKQYYSRYYQKVINVSHRFYCFEIWWWSMCSCYCIVSRITLKFLLLSKVYIMIKNLYCTIVHFTLSDR